MTKVDSYQHESIQKVIEGCFAELAKKKSKKKTLEGCLRKILTLDCLGVQPKGAIFLVSEYSSNSFELTVTTPNFPPKLLNLYREETFSHRLCKEAASSKKIIFTDNVDDLPETQLNSLSPSGHYSVPFFDDKGSTLGVLILYVDHSHVSTDVQRNTLNTISMCLGSVVQQYATTKTNKTEGKNHNQKLFLIAIALLGTILCTSIYEALRKSSLKDQQEIFEARIKQVSILIQKELKANESIVLRMGDFYNASNHVGRNEFKLFASGILKEYSYIQALEWIPLVTRENRSTFESNTRKDGYRNYSITEKSINGKLIKAEKREVYFPVHYIEPYLGNEQALGYDLNSNKHRRHALILSAQQNKVVVTEALTLVQDSSNESAILAFLPIFREKSLRGYVLCVYKLNALFHSILETNVVEGLSIDVREISSGNTIYSTKVASTSTLNGEDEIFFGGKKWLLLFKSTSSFKGNDNFSMNFIVPLLIAFIFSALFFAISFYFRSRNLFNCEKEKLKKNIERQNRTLGSIALISETDIQGVITYVNDKFCKVSNFSRAELLGSTHNIIDSGYHSKTFWKDCWDSITVGRPWQGEVCNRAKDGSFYWLYTIIVPIIGDDEIIGFTSTGIDKTKEKLELDVLVAELRDSQKISKLGRWELKIKENELRWSDELFEIFEINKENFKASYNAFLSLIHPDDRAMVSQAYRASLIDKESYEIEHRIITKTGKLKWLLARCSTIYDEDGLPRISTGIAQDITDLKIKSEKIQHQLKLASIGEMAAGIGHEINNPLAMGVGNLSRLKKIIGNKNLKSEEASLAIENIEVANTRIRNIVDGLRTYARADICNDEIISLKEICKQTINLISEIYTRDGVIVLENHPEKELYIKGSFGKVQQILMSLISNAKDSTSEQEVRKICITTKKVDNKCVLSVKDNGTGMSEDIKAKALDPFFTTKKVGLGTGMGLGIVNELILEMNGELVIDTKIDKGSIFSAIFPTEEKTYQNKKEKKNTKTEIKKQLEGTALVIDDEDGIRELLIECLEDLGLAVDEANDGSTGLEKVNLKKYDYICTDIKMKHMCGDEFILKASNTPNGETKYFVITGGVSGNQMDQVEGIIHGYIRKPFDENSIYMALTSTERTN